MTSLVEIIDMKQGRQSECRIQICQLNFADYDYTPDKGLYFLQHNEKIENKVMTLLSVAKQSSVDLIIFPELSIPATLIGKIQEWSREHNTIVIAGSHYHQSENATISRCPIIINGDVFFSEKISPSPMEKSPVAGEGLSKGGNIKKFINTSFGTIGILICADYLDEQVKSTLDLRGIDILCLPSFQKQSALYHERMNIDCENSNKGIFIAYSNFLDTKYGDGKSGLFGIMDTLYAAKLKEKGLTDLHPHSKLLQLNDNDEYAIIDISLNNLRPFINKNVATDPNVFFISKSGWGTVSKPDFIKKIAHDDERYLRIDEYFVEPKEYSAIQKSLSSNNLLFITGDPGIGKTYTAVKLLKEYFELGYEPLWFVGIDKEERESQVKTLASFTPGDKQIIYFEDPFGRSVFERKDILFQIFNPLLEKLSQFNCKIIITSRKEIFERFRDESLLEKEILDLHKELNVTNPSYSNDKLIEIFNKIANIHCDWYGNAKFREVVYKSITAKKITTPLIIRDLVFATRTISSIEELEEKIEKREHQTIKTFSFEIINISVSSKLFLYLVFFAGYKGHKLLSESYLSIIAVLKDTMSDVSGLSFNIELRAQVGYRVEQLGKIRTVYRFSHPVYEESLAMLATTNALCETISKTVILAFAKDDVTIAFQMINKIVLKYPDFALSLFKHLYESNQKIRDESLKISLTQKLIAIYFITRNAEFFQLAQTIYPLKDLVDSINDGGDFKGLGQKLNLVLRYTNNSPGDFDSSYSKNLDFNKLFKVHLRSVSSPIQVLNLMLDAASFSASVIPIFLQHISVNTFKRAYFFLKKNERKRLYDLLPASQHALKAEFDKIDLLSSGKDVKENRSRTNNQFREVAFFDRMYDGEITVDIGAEQALRKFWTSLLPAGIVKIEGSFEVGAVVVVKNSVGKNIGAGLAEYSSADLQIIARHSSSDFHELVGHYNGPAAIKRDLYLNLTQKSRRNEKWTMRGTMKTSLI